MMSNNQWPPVEVAQMRTIRERMEAYRAGNPSQRDIDQMFYRGLWDAQNGQDPDVGYAHARGDKPDLEGKMLEKYIMGFNTAVEREERIDTAFRLIYDPDDPHKSR